MHIGRRGEQLELGVLEEQISFGGQVELFNVTNQ